MADSNSSIPSNPPTRETRNDSECQPNVSRRPGPRTNQGDDQHIAATIDTWRSELMNSSKYGEILGIGRGLREEGGKIKRPYEKCIVIYVERRNELTANIPPFLDGIPVNVIVTGRIIAA
jgi:hypothetical protein